MIYLETDLQVVWVALIHGVLLRPGISITQAQAEVSALHAALHRNDGKEQDLVPTVHNLQEEFTFLAEASLKTTLWVLLGAVTFVLLIACLNIANLLLGQAVAREHELALSPHPFRAWF